MSRSGRSRPKRAKKPFVSTAEKAKSASRSSTSSSRALMRLRRSSGSDRVATTTCNNSGRASRNWPSASALAPDARWKSLITMTRGLGTPCRSSASAAMASIDTSPSTLSSSRASSPRLGSPKPCRRPWMTALTNRTESASPVSQLSHADGTFARSASQWASSVVFPAPGAPTTNVSRLPAPWSSSSNNRDRCTTRGTNGGAANFDLAKRGLGDATCRVCAARFRLVRRGKVTCWPSSQPATTDASASC